MSPDGKKLNLDELFGLARPVIVEWKGKEYELPRPEAFSAKAWSGFTALQEKIGLLQVLGEKLTDAQAEELDAITSDCIRYLSPKLADQELPFMLKVQVIQFYGEQISPAEPDAKNAPGSQTGEASSAGSASGTG
jgi:hypothetical protein